MTYHQPEHHAEQLAKARAAFKQNPTPSLSTSIRQLENAMKCSICGKEIELVPSARERAKKYGGTPGFYTKLFPDHAKCLLKKREADTLELMRRSR
jgi:hypothetical protein